jgi:cellulose biosynthesis protein BcsQ
MGNIITFYSYKGGVGRSMALANIGYELAKRKYTVLLVDWDLEAPGLERYFSNFKIENSTEGLLQLLLEFQKDTSPDYKKYLSYINTSNDFKITLLQSGRDNDPTIYTSQLGKFDWDIFFKENKGGLHLENLRQQWQNDFDFVLIDSRTGLSDSSGICTIMMPDILIPMFTANYQSLFGIRDIIKYIQTARQKLEVDRMALTILPIPSRFGTRVEFKESQEWLDRIADILKDCFSDWLPKWIEPRYILEQVKVPQIDYFSFGEKLAVTEQGTNDPEGMGFTYSRIASLLATDFMDIESFVGAEYFSSKKEIYENNISITKELSNSDYIYDVYISYPRTLYPWVKELLIPILLEYLTDELEYTPQIFFDINEINTGDGISNNLESSLQKSKTLLFISSQSDLNNSFSSIELNHFLMREKDNQSNVIFPVIFNNNSSEVSYNLPEILKNRLVLDFSGFKYDEIMKSTKVRFGFILEIEKLSKSIANSINQKKGGNKKSKKISQITKETNEKNELNDLLKLAEEYELIRETLPGGDNRTRKMTSIFTKMKSISVQNESLLETFSKSESPGERLVAIAILHKFPDINYINWLAEHVGDGEKPFVGFQASTGLYVASRTFGHKYNSEITNALEMATQNLNKYNFKDPNQVDVLKSAKMELTLKK